MRLNVNQVLMSIDGDPMPIPKEGQEIPARDDPKRDEKLSSIETEDFTLARAMVDALLGAPNDGMDRKKKLDMGLLAQKVRIAQRGDGIVEMENTDTDVVEDAVAAAFANPWILVEVHRLLTEVESPDLHNKDNGDKSKEGK